MSESSPRAAPVEPKPRPLSNIDITPSPRFQVKHSAPVPSTPAEMGKPRNRPVEKFRNSVRRALERAPFVDDAAITTTSAAPTVTTYPPEQMEQFEKLFHVITGGADFLSKYLIQRVFEFFTPCGCDDGEADEFLTTECNDIPGMTLEQFIRLGSVFRRRVFAYETLYNLKTLPAMIRRIRERTNNFSRSVRLRRYEREILRSKHAASVLREELRKNEPPHVGTLSPTVDASMQFFTPRAIVSPKHRQMLPQLQQTNPPTSNRRLASQPSPRTMGGQPQPTTMRPSSGDWVIA